MRRAPEWIAEEELPDRHDRTRPKAEADHAEGDERVTGVLGLQRLAINKAVGSLLARETAKDKGKGADKAKDKRGDDDKAVSTTLLMPDPIGVIPVDAYRLGERQNELVVVIPSTAADALLFKAAADGKELGTVTLSTGSGLSITIGGALISALHKSGDDLTMTLNGRLDMRTPQEKGEHDFDEPR